MYMRPWLTIVSLGLMLTTACDPKKETRTGNVSLVGTAHPFTTTSTSYPANTTAWPCPFDSRGTAPAPPAPGFQSVGYEHAFDRGTRPFPCQWRVNHVHRLVTIFDLSSIPHHKTDVFIKSAKLSFDKRHTAGDHECADLALAVVGPGPEPGTSIRPASNDKWETKIPLLPSGNCPGGRCTVDVAGQVNDWIRGVMSNQGFVLRGEDERLNANDNVSCRNEYANFRLDVMFIHDVKPGSTPILKPIEISMIKLAVDVASKTNREVVYRLQWTGATATSVDIHRNGAKYDTTPNDGSADDRAPLGTMKYKVCNAGTTNCSNEVTLTTN